MGRPYPYQKVQPIPNLPFSDAANPRPLSLTFLSLLARRLALHRLIEWHGNRTEQFQSVWNHFVSDGETEQAFITALKAIDE